MRWDLFAILMLVPWAATFLGSLTAVKVSLKTPRRQGGLLGFAPVMPVNHWGNEDFIARGGRIPAPLHSLRN